MTDTDSRRHGGNGSQLATDASASTEPNPEFAAIIDVAERWDIRPVAAEAYLDSIGFFIPGSDWGST